MNGRSNNTPRKGGILKPGMPVRMRILEPGSFLRLCQEIKGYQGYYPKHIVVAALAAESLAVRADKKKYCSELLLYISGQYKRGFIYCNDEVKIR